MYDWQDVVEFWFGELDDEGIPDSFHRGRWFRSSRSFDQEIRRRFLSLAVIAGEDGLQHWRSSAGGRLAEILLLDQFTRHIHRGGALAYANDKLCLKLCRQGLDAGGDLQLPSIERAFFYMPLQHSERTSDQALAVDLYRQLAATERGRLKPLMEGFLASSLDHQSIVQRFGRFPHRNQALARPSTSDELDYLKEGARRFGQ